MVRMDYQSSQRERDKRVRTALALGPQSLLGFAEPTIRVNPIFPGTTATSMQSKVYKNAGRGYDPSRLPQR